ncbi:MAG: CmpA/NrtA family ABC transporter substrate-binding protein [Luteolibacter sp.]
MPTSISKKQHAPIRLGFIAQSDCAPIVVAHEKGLFLKHGLDVNLSREIGWATVRDKISFGQLDASQSMAGLALGLGLGLGMMRSSITVPLVFSLQGNAITISKEIGRSLIGSGEGLQDYLSHSWKKDRPMILAVPHRFSSNQSLLSSWLLRNRVTNLDNLEFISLPPFLLPRQLKAGHIDGFCAPEPWNSEAILAGTGWCAATSADIASGHPESVLMVAGDFRDRNERWVVLLVAALIEACQLCQKAEFREEMISILGRKEYVGSSEKCLGYSLGSGSKSGLGRTRNEATLRFSGGNTNRPDMEKASWVLSQLRNEKTIPDHTGGSLSTIFREDMYMEAQRYLAERDDKEQKQTADKEDRWKTRSHPSPSKASNAELEKAQAPF